MPLAATTPRERRMIHLPEDAIGLDAGGLLRLGHRNGQIPALPVLLDPQAALDHLRGTGSRAGSLSFEISPDYRVFIFRDLSLVVGRKTSTRGGEKLLFDGRIFRLSRTHRPASDPARDYRFIMDMKGVAPRLTFHRIDIFGPDRDFLAEPVGPDKDRRIHREMTALFEKSLHRCRPLMTPPDSLENLPWPPCFPGRNFTENDLAELGRVLQAAMIWLLNHRDCPARWLSLEVIAGHPLQNGRMSPGRLTLRGDMGTDEQSRLNARLTRLLMKENLLESIRALAGTDLDPGDTPGQASLRPLSALNLRVAHPLSAHQILQARKRFGPPG